MKLNGAVGATTAVINSTNYLFVSSSEDQGISVFQIDDPAKPQNTFNIGDNTTLKLLGAHSPHVTTIKGDPYLFAIGHQEDGMSAFRIENGGTLYNVDNVTDGLTLKLNKATSVQSTIIMGKPYLFVSGYGENGISVFRVDIQ